MKLSKTDMEIYLKKVLIITYDWPPRNSIATHRPYSWARYLSEKGVEVTVLTAQKQFFDEPLDLDLPKLDGVRVVEVGYKVMMPMSTSSKNINPQRWMRLLKKIKGFITNLSGWEYDIRSNWAGAAEWMIKEVGVDFDVVISTYGPDSAHLIASKFKKMNPLLYWVADYRDLWSQNARKADSYFFKKIIKRKEVKVVGGVDLFTTVSHELSEVLRQLVIKKPEVIYNGFDIDLDPENYKRPLFISGGYLRIVYTGRIYPGKQSPLPIIKAIEGLIDDGKINPSEIKIHFYGGNTKMIDQEIGELKYPEILEHHGHFPRSDVLNLQKSADLLLLLESGDQDSKGILTGKIFEYIGAGRPIISIGSGTDSAIARVLNETGCGYCYVDDVKRIQSDIVSILNGAQPVWYKPNADAIEFYSRRKQAAILMSLIKKNMDINF